MSSSFIPLQPFLVMHAKAYNLARSQEGWIGTNCHQTSVQTCHNEVQQIPQPSSTCQLTRSYSYCRHHYNYESQLSFNLFVIDAQSSQKNHLAIFKFNKGKFFQVRNNDGR